MYKPLRKARNIMCNQLRFAKHIMCRGTVVLWWTRVGVVCPTGSLTKEVNIIGRRVLRVLFGSLAYDKSSLL